jgi:hypothetical protein
MHRGAAIVLAALWATAAQADELDRILERATLPPAQRYQHGYSDFTDPLGRFMDMLSAGAVDDARALQADACRTWLAKRDTSGWSGKFWVWDVEVSLDQLCGAR